MAPRTPVILVRDLRTMTLERWAMYGLLLVGLLSAVISFQALRWLASLVGVAPALTWLFPVAIDGVATVAAAATVSMLDKPLRLRSYLWGAVGFFLSVSIVGNCLHAIQYAPDGTILSTHPWAIAGVAALPPLAVAISVHLYIVLLRHSTGSAQRVPQTVPEPRAQAQAQRTPAPSTPAPAPSTPEASTPEAVPAQAPVPAQETASSDREEAYQRYAAYRLASGNEWVGREVAEACGVERSRGSRIRDTWRARFAAEHPEAADPAVERIRSVV